ncbi:hypothetical protein BDW59DRAFT_138456, partial [Aspergillus cavernicola]
MLTGMLFPTSRFLSASLLLSSPFASSSYKFIVCAPDHYSIASRESNAGEGGRRQGGTFNDPYTSLSELGETSSCPFARLRDLDGSVGAAEARRARWRVIARCTESFIFGSFCVWFCWCIVWCGVVD